MFRHFFFGQTRPLGEVWRDVRLVSPSDIKHNEHDPSFPPIFLGLPRSRMEP